MENVSLHVNVVYVTRLVVQNKAGELGRLYLESLVGKLVPFLVTFIQRHF